MQRTKGKRFGIFILEGQVKVRKEEQEETLREGGMEVYHQLAPESPPAGGKPPPLPHEAPPPPP